MTLQLINEDITIIAIDDLINIIKKQKPKRFNKENSSDLFNDPRVTDFAYVNLRKIYELSTSFRKTGVKMVHIAVDYNKKHVTLTSPAHEFKYNFVIWSKH